MTAQSGNNRGPTKRRYSMPQPTTTIPSGVTTKIKNTAIPWTLDTPPTNRFVEFSITF